MLTRRVVPCLDLRGGRVVKGINFRGLRDAGDPAELARRYEDDGADEIVLLDVDATLHGREHAEETVRAVRNVVAIPITAGGGIRSADDARRLLDAGADKVALNTAAYRAPDLITALASRFGSQCVTVSVDAAMNGTDWRVVVRAGSEKTPKSVVEYVTESEARGAGEILLTSVDRDGTQSGYDLDLTGAVASRTRIPVVASGGARTADDMVAAFQVGASAVLAASILHDGLTTVAALKGQLRAAGIRVRT
jgi:cyclase